jgi:effector-binding domain-containing protein
MRALKIIGVFVLVLIGLFLLVAIFLSDNVHIRETVEIEAPVNVVFANVNNFNNWQKWSPFQEKDPEMLITYEGPAEGVGATMKWISSEGDGYLKHTEVVPNISIRSDLNFEDMRMSQLLFEFENSMQRTIVAWSIDIKDLSYPMGRWMGLFMKGRMEDDFKQGLSNLKSICETGMLVDVIKWRTSEVVEKNVEPILALSIKDSCTVEGFSDKFKEIFSSITEHMQKMKVKRNGFPFCVYYTWNPEGVTVFEAGIPISRKVDGKDRIVLSELSGGKALMVSQFGPYESTGDAHNAIDKYMKDNNKVCNGAPWEVYITEPGNEPDTAKWETQIYYPIE